MKDDDTLEHELISDEESGATAEGRDSPAARTPLAQVVAAHLRDMIAQNELEPGARVRERSIAHRLSVSRTPMREALRILAAERLVELLPNRGAVVSKPSPKEVKDLLSVLAALEALAGEQAAANASDAELAEVRALHFEMLATFERGDRLAYFKLNQAIHRAIVAASHNAALIEMHAQTNARLYRIRYQSNQDNDQWPTAIGEHEAILQAFCARDGEGLAQILRSHLGNTWTKVRERLEADQPEHSAEDESPDA